MKCERVVIFKAAFAELGQIFTVKTTFVAKLSEKTVA